MRIDVLDLLGFGKFKNKKIEFDKGVNLIFGNNEAGKSTLQSFIKAMFFSGRSVKSTDYVKKFEPWQGDYFGGSLHYRLDNGEAYKIQRNFKSNEIKIFDQMFNEVSSTFDVSREKGPLFAYKHLGVNEQFFDQTVFVKQMETKLSLDARKNIVESAVNLVQTGIENISLERILDELNSLLKLHIGNSRTRSRPLEQIISEIEDMKISNQELIKKREDLLKKISENSSFLQTYNFEKRKNAIILAVELEKMRRELFILENKKASQESVYRSMSIKDDYVKEAGEKKCKYLNELLGEKNKLQDELEQKGNKLCNLELELEKNRINIKSAQNYNNKIEENLGIIQKENSSDKEIKVTDILFKRYEVAMPTILAIIAYFIIKLFSISNIFAACTLLFAIFYPSVMVIMEFKSKNEEKNKAMNELAGIFQGLGVKDASEYYRRISDFELRIKEFDNLSNDIEEVEVRIERIENLINSASNSESKSNEKEDAQEIKDVKKELDQISMDYCGKENEIQLALKNLRIFCENEGLFEFWDEILNSYNASEANLLEFIEINQEEISKEQESGFIKLKENEIALKSVEETDEGILKLEEEIAAKEERKKKMEDISFSVGTAISVFKDAGEELKNGTMPMLLNNFSTAVEKITSGKYKKLSIDDRFEIKAIEPAIENIVDVTTLSGGTLEQIYLALRLSLADSAMGGKERLPLILDEVFAYYDDVRTVQSCKFLQELSLDRQVILFTCKTREMEIAKETFGSKLNCIELTNL